MLKNGVYTAPAAALIGSLAPLAACSSGFSQEEMDKAVNNARQGMMTEAEANAMVENATANMMTKA